MNKHLSHRSRVVSLYFYRKYQTVPGTAFEVQIDEVNLSSMLGDIMFLATYLQSWHKKPLAAQPLSRVFRPISLSPTLRV